MKMKLTGVLFAFTLLTFGINGYASDETQKVINKLLTSYGGDKLQQVKTLRLTSRYKRFNYGQSLSPDVVDMEDNIFSIRLDLVNQRNDFRWIRADLSDFVTQHQLFDGEQGYRLDHTDQSVIENNGLSYQSADRDHINNFDIALVLLLRDDQDKVAYDGDVNYKGINHHKLKFKPEARRPLTLYVNSQNGYISKMTQPHWLPGKYFSYIYADMRKAQGISYAGESYLAGDGKPMEVTLSREVEINPDLSSVFELPKGFKAQAPTLDMSKMAVKPLAKDVYLVGSHWGFSVFYDQGEYFIATGGYRGLSKRFEAVKNFIKADKPLKYQIVSHHHNDHLAGLNEAAQLGASFITVDAHVTSIRNVVESSLSDERFILVRGQAQFANGMVKVVDHGNAHAQHNLLSYFVPATTVFAADIYASYQADGAPAGYEGLKQFKQILTDSGWKFTHIASAHSIRVLTAADLEESISRIVDEVCPQTWRICR